ncbi:MAG: methyltransferase domain-containing protein, partial [Kangiellaceae bacterium]|nr:methyltransferase domain-containing protein [Kangiellaceae bacterium]
IGTAEKTGLKVNSIDGIIATLTIHHWTHLYRAFSELESILKPKGRVVIFTSTPMQMEGYWLNHFFPKMLGASMEQMPSLEEIDTAISSSNLEIIKTVPYFIKPDLKDQFLYCGKQNPELYFNESIRHGISSFSALANRDEVERGLARLRSDIDSGSIHDIIKSYENDFGDYAYLIMEKK